MISMTIKGTHFDFTLQEAIDLAMVLKSSLDREILGDPRVAVTIPARVEYGHPTRTVTFMEESGPLPSLGATLIYEDQSLSVVQQHQAGELCTQCANYAMIRTGTCLTCQVCGNNTGCS